MSAVPETRSAIDDLPQVMGEDGEFHATADTCSHEKWSLGEDAELEGNEVVCPLHMARFDVRTGAPLCLPATTALRTYPLEIEGDDVYVLV